MINGTIDQENIILIHMHPKYIKQLLTDLKGETDSSTVIVGDFNTPTTAMDRSPRQSQQGNIGLK